jgi:RNA polymerase sigma factor (sigma-70 family)
MERDHAQLVVRCKAGDEKAWFDLVAEFGPLVFAIARRVGLSEDNCEDAAQATFAALAHKLDTIHEPAALPGWLSTTARREAIRLSKEVAKRRGRGLDHDPEGTNEPAWIEEVETHYLLRRALGQLGPKCRNLLRALYFEGSNSEYQAVADRLGMAVGSIGPTRKRCLAKLAEIFSGHP